MSELLYGRRSVLEALRAGRRHIYRLWLDESIQASAKETLQEITGLAEAQKLPVRTVRGGLFQRLEQERRNAQGVALEVDAYPYVELADCLERARAQGEAPLLLLLDQVQDPQNLGTLFRTAEGVGAHGVVLPQRRAAGVTPAVSNSSAGAVEHLLVAQVGNLNQAVDELKRQGTWVAGLDAGAAAVDLGAMDLDRPLALVVGSEESGISHLTRQKCDFLLRLAMYGRVASYNAAVAGSIALYAARQARGAD